MRVYEVGGGARVGARVAYVVGPELERVDGLALARRLGAPLTVLECDARRDDCARRLRVFTPTRELPLSVEAAWCAGEARREAIVVEMGVTATAVRPDGESWIAALPTPVLGQRAVGDRALVAAALGLDEAELDAACPVLAGSCGVNVLVVPVAARASLDRARLHPDAWQRVMEKAKHVGALVVAGEGGGREARFVGAPSGLWDGTGCALALAPWALAQAREGALGESARYALRGEAGFGMELDVAHSAAEGWSMRGAAGLVSDGLALT
ncbi:MAG: phenazine biosynthesis protein PhzF family [Myxococcaceae bacterium]|nr:phenazine biosynthesis protein PhzF family [Myxococcaceae bacterium]